VSVDLGKGRRASDQTALVYTPWTGRPYEARVVAVDGIADIALLRMPQAGFPALPVEGLTLKDENAAKTALEKRPLRLYGFPLSYGEATVAALAKPEHNDSQLQEITKKGETNLCALRACPDVQPGWSGGPMVAADTGAVVAVFHSLYRPAGTQEKGFPAGSLSGYLGDLLRQAGAPSLEPFSRPAAPTIPRPAGAAERMAHEMRSLSWSAEGQWKKAEEEQRELIKALPEDAAARTELGRLLLVQQRRDEEAVKELREAVRLGPKSVFAHLQLARALFLTYDLKGAIAELRAALETSPNEVEPQLALAQMYEESQKPEEAEKVLRAAMQAAPNHPMVAYRLGNLLLKTQREPEGYRLLSQAAEMAYADAALSAIPLGYARSLDAARKYKEAETVYRQVTRVDPENAICWYYLAQLLLRVNRPEEAQIALNRGIQVSNLSEAMVRAFQALQVKINEKGSN
ncbi:MAG TPA: tetratricopeptide repeat protein, partial [Armatimonadota bacterium]|nr:tetratricopeptide repeat protein [Armatimonadota bacterium]